MDVAEIRREELRLTAVQKEQNTILDAMYDVDVTLQSLTEELSELTSQEEALQKQLQRRPIFSFLNIDEIEETLDSLRQIIVRQNGKINQEKDKLRIFDDQLMEYAFLDDHLQQLADAKYQYIAQFEPAQSQLAESQAKITQDKEKLELFQKAFVAIEKIVRHIQSNETLLFQEPMKLLERRHATLYLNASAMIMDDSRRKSIRRKLVKLTEAYFALARRHSAVLLQKDVIMLKRALLKNSPDALKKRYYPAAVRQLEFVTTHISTLEEAIGREQQQVDTLVGENWKRLLIENDLSN